MSNILPVRLGQAALAGDAKALFMKIFSGQVLVKFEEVNKFLNRLSVRTIASGKSASFGTIGSVSAEYHVPGTELPGGTVDMNEKIITVDDLLVAHKYLASIDEAMNHFDVAGPLAEKLAFALSNQMDRHLLQMLALAARTTTNVSGMPAGTVITQSEVGAAGIDFATDSEDLIAALFAAATALDEKNIPDEGRFAAIPPKAYHLLAQNTKVMNKDWGGAGVYADGKVLRVAGIELIKTNNIPSTVITTGTDAGPAGKYAGDFTNTIALVGHKEAVGTVKLMDLNMESAWIVDKRSELMVAEYALGHGVLRPECAVEIRNVA